jgi:hypothetical protein
MICPYLLAAVLSNPETYGYDTHKNVSAKCQKENCQMWTSKYIKGEGFAEDCGLKGEPRL